MTLTSCWATALWQRSNARSNLSCNCRAFALGNSSIASNAPGDEAISAYGPDPFPPFTLTTTAGKATVVQRLYLPRPLLMVGDGVTDLAARPAADSFAAFTGFAYRSTVARGADHEVSTFEQLLRLVMS